MGVGVQRESCGVVAEHGGYGFDVYTVLERHGGEGVSEVMEADAGQPRPLQHPVQHIIHAVR